MKISIPARHKQIVILIFTLFFVVNGSPRDHTFHGNTFDFNVWKQGRDGFQCPHDQQYVILCKLRWDIIIGELELCMDDGFQCPHDQQYVILCKLRWDIIIGELELCMDGGVQCANGTVVTSTVIIAIEAIAIGALMIYACRMRKKVIRNTQSWMVRIPRRDSVDSSDTSKT